jgi:hypothetical protein
MGGTPGTEAGRIQRVPLAPGTQDEDNGLYSLTIINAASMAPQRVQLPWGKPPLEACPQLIMHAPITMSFLLVGAHRTGSCGSEFLPTGYHQIRLLG